MEVEYKKYWKGYKCYLNGEFIFYVVGSVENAKKEFELSKRDNMSEDIESLLKLNNGEHYVVPQSDYGKAEVWLINNAFFVFEVPMYGGDPNYATNFPFARHKQKAAEQVMSLIDSWT